jgi:hypothetical protein
MRTKSFMLSFLVAVASFSSVSGCADDLGATETLTHINPVVMSVKDSGGTFQEQARALYIVNQLSLDPSSFYSKIKTCRLNRSSNNDCDKFLIDTLRSVNAYNVPKQRRAHCDRLCKVYRSAELLMEQDLNRLADEVVVFNPSNKPIPKKGGD